LTSISPFVTYKRPPTKTFAKVLAPTYIGYTDSSPNLASAFLCALNNAELTTSIAPLL